MKIREIKCDNSLADLENIMSIMLSNEIHVCIIIFITISICIFMNVLRIIILQVFETPH